MMGICPPDTLPRPIEWQHEDYWLKVGSMMSDKDEKQTTPTGHEIPIPKREEVLNDLKKVAKPVDPAESPDSETREE